MQFTATESRKWGLIFVLIGPAGVGKNAIMTSVLERIPTLRQIPTATTRTIRNTEQQGREHLFISRSEFEQMIADKALIEHQVIHGELYGIPRMTVEAAIAAEQDIIADIDVLGASDLRLLYPENTVLIFVQPPSVAELRQRMETRGESQAEIDKRMLRVDTEMPYAVQCDYLITNDSLMQACETMFGIVLAERSHRAVLQLREANAVLE
ncbi:MAG: guanylate kinase [Anaerolineae bacterium]|nr:guanylate kinase [Anaerolineae bacterium]